MVRRARAGQAPPLHYDETRYSSERTALLLIRQPAAATFPTRGRLLALRIHRKFQISFVQDYKFYRENFFIFTLKTVEICDVLS